jgi:DNA-binding XRE family transcriptional regulator
MSRDEERNKLLAKGPAPLWQKAMEAAEGKELPGVTSIDLVSYRQDKKYTQADLAKVIGVNQIDICLWEREQREIPKWAQVAMASIIRGLVNLPAKPDKTKSMRALKEEYRRKLLSSGHTPERWVSDEMGGWINTCDNSHRNFAACKFQVHITNEKTIELASPWGEGWLKCAGLRNFKDWAKIPRKDEKKLDIP